MSRKFDLTGTHTAENLAKAFAVESQARNRYLFYAEIAKKEGYPSLEQVFLEIGDNERGHAEVLFDYLTAGLTDTVLHPHVLVMVAKATTPQNLLSSAKAEREEWTDIYPQFAKEARQEGFEQIAQSLLCIASIEKHHETRFANLLKRYEKNMLYSLPYETMWECTNCGFVITGHSAPEICPACLHKQAYYKIFCNNLPKI